MTKLNFQQSSIQDHMILQKSFLYDDLMLKKHFFLLLLLTMLKTVFAAWYFCGNQEKLKICSSVYRKFRFAITGINYGLKYIKMILKIYIKQLF